MSAIADTLAELRVPIESVHGYPGNPRRGDVAAIRRSLEVNGQYRPIVVNRRTGDVLAGNHTWRAARELEWQEIAATFVDVDDEQAARIVLVDNRTGDLGVYDDGELVELLRSLPALEGSGYLERDVESLEALLAMADTEIQDTAAQTFAGEPRTRPGDLFALGAHRLICGDCRDPDVVARLLEGATVQLALTSPPYAGQREYDKASPFRPVRAGKYVAWFKACADNVAAHLSDDGSWCVNIKPGASGLDTELYVFDLVLAHVREWGWHFATEFSWERVGVPKQPSQRLKNQFEPIYQFVRGRWKFRPDHVRHLSDAMIVPAGEGAGDMSWDRWQGGGAFFKPSQVRPRKRGTTKLMSAVQGQAAAPGTGFADGWAYPGNRLPTFTGSHEALGHEAAFPVGLADFFVKLFTDERDVVLDPFIGSGSTLIAGENLGRPVVGVEVSPTYCDMTIDRWQRHTGREAELLEREEATAAAV